MKKTIILKIIIFFLLYILLLTSLTMFFVSTQETEILQEEELFVLTDLKNPNQMIWYEDVLFLKKNSNVKSFDIEKRELVQFMDIEKNEVLTIYKNNLVLINHTNHVITSPKEDATDIVVLSLDGDEIFSQSFHETIAPLFIEKNYLFLIDNYPNSPERTYRVNLESGDIEMFEIEEKIILKGDESIEVFDEKSNLLLNIPKVNDITSFSVNENFNKIALLDIQGNVWIYLKNPDN